MVSAAGTVMLSGHKSLFVVLGPSGSSKSSFLRAGLIPRLQRDDRRFVMLGIVRPERSALTGDRGLAAAIHTARNNLKLPDPPLGDIKQACLHDPERLYELLGEMRAAAKGLAGIDADDPRPRQLPPIQPRDLLTFPWVGSWPSRDLPSGPRECAGQVSDLPFRLPSGRAEARGSRVAEGHREATRSALDARGVRP